MILAAQRRRYLDSLRRADRGKPTSLGEVIARAVSGAPNRFLIPRLAGDVKLVVPLSALEARGRLLIGLPAPAGPCRTPQAVREKRLWLSSSAWLDDYIQTRDPRGGERGRARRTAQH